jgi:hypothetical protein
MFQTLKIQVGMILKILVDEASGYFIYCTACPDFDNNVDEIITVDSSVCKIGNFPHWTDCFGKVSFVCYVFI